VTGDGGPVTPGESARDEVERDRFVGDVDLTHWYSPLGRRLARFARFIAGRLGPNASLIVTLVVGGLIAFVLSFLAARVYDAVTDRDGVAGLDRPLLDLALRLRSPSLDSLLTGFTNIAGPIGMPIIAVVALLILGIARRSWTPVILIAASGIGSLLMTIAGKDIIGRNRPPLVDAVRPYEYSPSFPSGHTLNATVIAGIIAYLLILRIRRLSARIVAVAIAAVFALAIGLSRVFLGHHWFTDVLAGWILGAAWLALVITAHRLYLTVRKAAETARDARALIDGSAT
jgi:membrane-associated phospholipid phosphatase